MRLRLLFGLLFCSLSATAFEQDYLIFQGRSYDVKVYSAVEYDIADYELNVWLKIDFEQPLNASIYDERLTSDVMFLRAWRMYKIDCNESRSRPLGTAIFLYDASDSLVTISRSSDLLELFDNLPIQAVHKATRFACVMTLDNHPFQTQNGWRVVSYTDDGRWEMHERPHRAIGTEVEVWITLSYLVNTDAGAASERNLLHVDCKNRLLTTVERTDFTLPFAKGASIANINYRTQGGLRSRPTAAAPGTPGETILEAACKLLPKVQRETPPLPNTKPQQATPTERT